MVDLTAGGYEIVFGSDGYGWFEVWSLGLMTWIRTGMGFWGLFMRFDCFGHFFPNRSLIINVSKILIGSVYVWSGCCSCSTCSFAISFTGRENKIWLFFDLLGSRHRIGSTCEWIIWFSNLRTQIQHPSAERRRTPHFGQDMRRNEELLSSVSKEYVISWRTVMCVRSVSRIYGKIVTSALTSFVVQ